MGITKPDHQHKVSGRALPGPSFAKESFHEKWRCVRTELVANAAGG